MVSPNGSYADKLRQHGFEWRAFDFERKGTNPLTELQTLRRLAALYHELSPDLVHHFTIKCVLYGGIAAHRLGIPTVAAVTGLGHVFTTQSVKNAALRPLISAGYRYALGGAQVIFQNPDDRAEFLSRHLVDQSRTHLIGGSGVNTTLFSPTVRRTSSNCRILFVGRLLREKGIYEFIEAARLVRDISPNTKFMIAGEPDAGNPSSVTSTQIAEWRDTGDVQFLGHCSDMPSLLSESDICVLPSYREGTPRSLLEAAACGLPLVASDVPGCREVCRDALNGFLVPARDSVSLSKAILRLVADPALRAQMSLSSREIAVCEFADERVIEETLKVYTVARQAINKRA